MKMEHEMRGWGRFDPLTRLVFETGRVMYVERAVIGLESERRRFWEGFDNELDPDDKLSPSERVELAEYMLSQWEAFRQEAFRCVTAEALQRQPEVKDETAR
jgi:hypothetical protein